MTHGARFLCLAGTVILAGAAPAMGQFHEGDLGVARTFGGTLQVVAWSGQPVFLPPVNGVLAGWAANSPGFDRVDAEAPAEDIFQLQPGAQIRLEAVSVPDAFKVWAANLSTRIDAPGQSLPLGDHNLHTHLVWHIDSTDPLFDPGQSTWTAAFRLVDTGTTQYSPSGPFEMTFTNIAAQVPAVSSWGACILGLLVLSGGTVIGQRRMCRPVFLRAGPIQGDNWKGKR